MKGIELKDGIYWVGAIDWAVRDFHGYETPRGTSYNNYLIVDEEPTLVDTVKYDFADLMIKNIKGIMDPRAIKHVIINHIENDHATGIDRIMHLAPGATIHMTERGRKGLERFFDISGWTIKTVKDGRHAEDRQKDHPFPRNAHAPLARFHGLLRKGGEAPLQPGRLRPAYCLVCPLRR